MAKYLSYAWLVIENLITLVVAWLLYSIAANRFEIIIVSLLLIIYAQLVTSASSLALVGILNSLKSTKQFLHILKILKISNPHYKEYMSDISSLENSDKEEAYDRYSYSDLAELYGDDKDTKESIKDQEKEIDKITIKSYIAGFFVFLIYVLAVWKIISTLM
jgi:hypothetical protein